MWRLCKLSESLKTPLLCPCNQSLCPRCLSQFPHNFFQTFQMSVGTAKLSPSQQASKSFTFIRESTWFHTQHFKVSKRGRRVESNLRSRDIASKFLLEISRYEVVISEENAISLSLINLTLSKLTCWSFQVC